MKNQISFLLLFIFTTSLFAQKNMEPEDLWKVKDVSANGLSKDAKHFYFSVNSPNMEENSFDTKYYKMPIGGGEAQEVSKSHMKSDMEDRNISPDGKYKLFHKSVKINKVLGKDLYDDLQKSNAYVFEALDFRHWDVYNDGSFNHVFYKDLKTEEETDIMKDEPYYTPQAPFGGEEDYVWGSDSKNIYYVSKKKEGTAYVKSTDTDIYKYNLESKKTENLTEENKGYDTNPQFSKNGALAYLQMETPGYEADKNDIIVLENGVKQNLTANWDETVLSYIWADNGKELYFNAPVDGTIQIFKVNYPGKTRIAPVVEQISKGKFDVTGITAQVGNKLLVSRTDMNTAAEIYSFDLKTKKFEQLTHVNKELYEQFDMPKIEKRYVTTKDGYEMLVWVILPPNFDKNKKYPTLLYAQGGPQSPLSQFYSRRWNFQLMASQGYVIVAPNRRGMPGHGVEWNEIISKKWGEGVMQDYLDAIDDVAKEPYVDKDRLGAVGASFGGYSVFWLAGNHEGRFKSFISHDGVFDLKTMYGTTEEVFFIEHEIGGPYWEKDNKTAQKAFEEYNPINFVQNWDTPIYIIQGDKDYRVPTEQGLSAFQAAQLRGIKSKLLFLPDENHWVLQPQNAMVWQREFFKWLKETL